MKTPPKLLPAGAWLPVAVAMFFTVTTSSCYKLLVNPPIPNPILQSLEEFPVEAWIDSINSSALYHLDYQIGGPIISAPDQPTAYGQIMLTYALRTSVPGAVTSLAIFEPASGYAHTVYLWDSAAGTILATANVTTVDSGQWASVSLALNGQEVPIQANHGYVLGFNTLAVGRPLDDGTPGERFYAIFLLAQADNPDGLDHIYPLTPFTSKSFTIESESIIFYDNNTPLPSPPYGPFYTGQGQMDGVVDIGFIPEPQ